MLTLNDLELPLEDLRTVGGFLASAVARAELRLIVVRRTILVAGRDSNSSSKGGSQKQKSKADHLHAAYSAFRVEGGSLFRSLCDCVARCTALHCLVVDGVDFNEDMMRRLGASIARCPSNMGRLRFQDCSFGDAGFRAITPYLARSRCRVLELVKCGLSDTSMSYVASILKAQEGNMDHSFWNDTLRMSPVDFRDKKLGAGVEARVGVETVTSSATGVNGALQWEQAGPEVKAIRAQVPGLKVISLAGNAFSDKSMYAIGKFLRNNPWLAGLNLAHNDISEGGIKHLANALATNTALHTLVIAGNPGYRKEIGTVLDSMSQTLPSSKECMNASASGIKKGNSVKRGGTQKGGTVSSGGLADTLERYGGYLSRQGMEAALEDWGCNAAVEDADVEKEKDCQATREALLHRGGAAPEGDKCGPSAPAAAPPPPPPPSLTEKKKKKKMKKKEEDEGEGRGKREKVVVLTSSSTTGVEKRGPKRARPATTTYTTADAQRASTSIDIGSSSSQTRSATATVSRGGRKSGDGDRDKKTKTKIKSPAKVVAAAAAAAAADGVGSPSRTSRLKQPASVSPSSKVVGMARPTKSPTVAKKVATRVGDRQRQQAAAEAAVAEAVAVAMAMAMAEKAEAEVEAKAGVPCEAEIRDMVRESLRRQLVMHLRC
jgi:hypothetical protein